MTAQEFATIRSKLGLTQVQLAERLGYKHAYQISVYENGHRPVPPLLARLMAAYAAGYVPA